MKWFLFAMVGVSSGMIATGMGLDILDPKYWVVCTPLIITLNILINKVYE